MKLPVCPYCEARFLYPDVKQRMKLRTGVCPHCGKEFRVSRRGLAIFLPCAAAALIALNCGLLTIPDMNLLFLCAVTAAGVAGAYFLLPFAVRFRQAGPVSASRRADRRKPQARSGGR
jgi:hypothetical protein